MKFSAWSIKNPTPAIMFFVMVTVAGLASFATMKVQQFPDLGNAHGHGLGVLPGGAGAAGNGGGAGKLENATARCRA